MFSRITGCVTVAVHPHREHDMNEQEKAIERAIAIFGAQNLLAKELGVSKMAVCHWRKNGSVPIERCPDIERLTGGQVTRAQLRPDIFGDLELSA